MSSHGPLLEALKQSNAISCKDIKHPYPNIQGVLPKCIRFPFREYFSKKGWVGGGVGGLSNMLKYEGFSLGLDFKPVSHPAALSYIHGYRHRPNCAIMHINICTYTYLHAYTYTYVCSCLYTHRYLYAKKSSLSQVIYIHLHTCTYALKTSYIAEKYYPKPSTFNPKP